MAAFFDDISSDPSDYSDIDSSSSYHSESDHDSNSNRSPDLKMRAAIIDRLFGNTMDNWTPSQTEGNNQTKCQVLQFVKLSFM